MMASEIHVAMKGLVVKDGKFLALQQKADDKIWWDLPGGRMKYGEEPENVLSREIFEETGLKIEILKQLGTWYFFRSSDNSQVICFTFLCRPVSERIELDKNPDEEEEIVSCRWVTPEEFLNNSEALMPHESLKKIINDYYNKM